MNKATNAPKSAAQVAAGQLKKIARRNEAAPKFVIPQNVPDALRLAARTLLH